MDLVASQDIERDIGWGDEKKVEEGGEPRQEEDTSFPPVFRRMQPASSPILWGRRWPCDDSNTVMTLPNQGMKKDQVCSMQGAVFSTESNDTF